MLFGILSDIHSNWEALECAVEYLKKHKIHEHWVLGDTVGYGANPNECFSWAVQNARVHLAGNHEKAVVDPAILEDFTDDAREAAIWTTRVMNPEHRKKIHELSYMNVNSSATLAHGSPHEPEKFHYLFTAKDTWPAFHAFKTALCFVGHTHVPALFREHSDKVQYLTPGVYVLERNEHYILNPGSVGQPRDGDKRLSFGIFDDKAWTFEIVWLEYDNEQAARKIRKADLPRYLADRLL